jgi:hypothetical protein
MAKDPDEIVVGQNGEIYTAPTGTAAPTTEVSALNAAFVDLGYASEDGVTLSDGKTVENVGVWQSFYPARRIVTAREFNVTFALRQWNKDTVELAFGGTVTEPSSGHFKFSPPAPEDLDIRAVVVDWRDGDRNFRLYIPKAIITESVESNINRGSASDLPVTLSVLAEEGDGDPWNIFTDDESWSS